jgi:hypothetical protein
MNSKDDYIPLTFINIYNILNGTWKVEELKGDIPTLRSGMKSISFPYNKQPSLTQTPKKGSKHLVFGGYHMDKYFNDIFILSLKNLAWERTFYVEDSIESKTDFTVVKINQKIYVYGGRDNYIIYDGIEEVGTIGIDSNCFGVKKLNVNGKKPTARFGHAAVAMNSSM